MRKPKIIIFDLEILPNLNEALKVWTQLSQFPGKTMKATITSIINAGWKEYGSKKTHCINAWDFPEWDDDINNDKQVCLAIKEVLEDADAVVTHNGKRFDWKYLQTRLTIHGIPPLGKIHHIDTCSIARANLYLFNNKLSTVGQFLADDNKMQHEGWDLWVKVHGRDPKAMKTMEKYCKQDVKLLEKVYDELLPFIKNAPNRNLFRSHKQWDDCVTVCPSCGSEKLKSKGWRTTKTKMYRRFQCKDCGSYSTSDSNDKNLRSF